MRDVGGDVGGMSVGCRWDVGGMSVVVPERCFTGATVCTLKRAPGYTQLLVLAPLA